MFGPSGARSEGSHSPVASALIGRDDVVALARRRTREAASGRGQFLLLAGEAGIGKSRMLREIAATVPDLRQLTASAWPRDVQVAGALVFDLAGELRRAGLAELGDALRERMLDVNGSGDAARRRRLLVGDIADQVAELLTTGILLFLEDLHWADEVSLEVLERLAGLVRTTPSLVIGTYRSDEVLPGSPLAGWRSRLLGQRLAEEVRLARLDRDQTRQLAEAILGTVSSSDYVDALFLRSGGLPLHVEELIAAGSTDAVPENIAEAVRARVGQLSGSSRDVVVTAAVIGCAFDFSLLEASSPETPEVLDHALRELRDHHLLVDLAGTDTFDFRHALLRDSIYADIAPGRRRALHAAVADAAVLADMRDAYISQHYERAGLAERAHPHALLAARDASGTSAHCESAELYARALRTAPEDDRVRAELQTRLGVELAAIDENERAADAFATAIALYRGLGDDLAAANAVPNLIAARHLLGDDLTTRVAMAEDAIGWLDALPGADDALVRAGLLGSLAAAQMLERRLDDSIAYGERAIPFATGEEGFCDRIDISLTLGTVLAFAGRGSEGWPMLESTIAAARAAGFDAELARGYRMMGSSASVLLDYPRAERWITEGMAATAAVERWNDHHYLRAHHAHVRWALGDLAGAEAEARRALADGRGITTQITGLYVLGYCALSRDRLGEARELLSKALVLAEQLGELQRVSPVLWGLAELALAEGRDAEAVAMSMRAASESERVRDAAYLFPFAVTGMRALLAVRDLDGARNWLERIREVLADRAIPGTLTALVHAEGLLALAESRWAPAREALERARTEWDDTGRAWEGTMVLLDLIRCARRGRRPGEAAGLAAQIIRRADETGAVTFARRIDGVDIDPAAIGRGPLTEREYEVARLVAEGATNREIAVRLTIAPKTASAHIEHILAKLDVARRSEIAAWVSRGDLSVLEH